MDALAFLDKSTKTKRQPAFVLHGDEDFLKRLARDRIIAHLLGDSDPTFAVSNFVGDKLLDFSTVRNDLDTLPFLGSLRIAIVEQADPFVTNHREALERYLAQPSKIGVLILDVKTFPETTKLAKALPDLAKIACKAPQQERLGDWCRKWCPARHGKKLTDDAANVLVELIGGSMGQLDQEMEKLAVAVGEKAEIEPDDVERLVIRSRAANAFHILDAIGDGKPAAALGLVADLYEEGEETFAILAQFGSQLRKLASVNRQLARGQSLGAAMDAAGVAKWPQMRQKMEQQIRHLGRRRLNHLTEWMMEVNMGLRGDSPLPERLQLERLVVKLARPRQ